MSYRVLRGLPCPRFCKRQSVSCCLKSRECPFLSKESVSPERLHLFSLFFSVLTFSNLGKEVCRSVVSRHDLEIPRWSAPYCGDTFPYSSAAMFFCHSPGRKVLAVSTAGVCRRHDRCRAPAHLAGSPVRRCHMFFLSLSRPSSFFCPAGCQLDLMKSLGRIPNWA